MDPSAARSLILIVDDAPANIRILSQALKDEFEIAIATNGTDALDAVADNPPDLILLDVMMPGMDGHEVCRHLKADPSKQNIPVIFLTGKEAEDDEIAGLELGAVDYIIKPFSTAIVKARIRTHLELKRCRDLLENMALLDALTGIPNRRRFEDFLDFAWRQSQRQSQHIAAPLSVIILDVDHFKAYNDHYGHQAGDECLRAVAQALDGAKRRATDLVARYGGEEFVAVLPSTDAKGAMIFAETLRLAVDELKIPHAHSSAADHVTVSLGVATIVPIDGATPSQLIKQADQGLYRAKAQGRNRVETYSEISELVDSVETP